MWLAWPTLAPGAGQIKTAGVFYYKRDLNKVAPTVGSLVMAELKIEAKGKYAGAIGVFIAGKMLGHIPHDLVGKFHPIIEDLSHEGSSATCRAELEWGEFCDVWLDVSPRRLQPGDPFLPSGPGTRVVLFPGQSERLNDEMHSKAKSKRIVKTGTISEIVDGWQMSIDDEPIGVLEKNRPEISSVTDCFTILNEVVAAGFPLTCRVRILRDPEKPLRVMADFPLRFS